jgi:serine/threonine protein phosphatase PrpC
MLPLSTSWRHVASTTAFVRASICRRTLSVSAACARRQLIFSGQTTNDDRVDVFNKSPFYLDTGYAIFAKRPSRPFPPPFLSTPSHSFSDPLTTHQDVRSRKPHDEQGHVIGGITNGDDAIIVGGQNFLAVNDGVGAWAQKDRGHAALWSRLIAHYWVEEAEKQYEAAKGDELEIDSLDMVSWLQKAYEHTKESTHAGGENEIMGTTTASGALLHHDEGGRPCVLCTTVGDSMVYIVRPDRGAGGDAGSEDEAAGELLYKTTEQWHWFDCPRQLGTNSPDTPDGNATMDRVVIEEGDVVIVVSDGVTDNLFENEIVEKVCGCVKSWEQGALEAKEGMTFVALELMNAAREIAQDPNAESPYMEKALDEGISAFGGKLDDISVVVGVCRRREG